MTVVGFGVCIGTTVADAKSPVKTTKVAAIHKKSVKAKSVARTDDADCYTDAEFEAEQGIRLHTELMVAGLTCQRYDPSKPYFDQYNIFTHAHRAQIMAWEAALINHYRHSRRGDPTRAFDTLRTEIANESARRAQLMTTPVYCGQAGAFVAAALKLTPEALRQRVADFGRLPLATEKLCRPHPGGLPVLQPAAVLPLPTLEQASLPDAKVAAAK